MKAIIGHSYFGGKIEIHHGETIISSEGRDFSVRLNELQAFAVKQINVSPGGLTFQIEQEDGWIIDISRGIHEKGYLVVTRFKRPKAGVTREYLTKYGEWLPTPEGYGPYPSNIMKIPIPAPEKVPA